MSRALRRRSHPHNRLFAAPPLTRRAADNRSHSASPPACVWRELWYHQRVDGWHTLTMNATIWREKGIFTGEFYVFWDGVRVSQLDQRITEPQSMDGLAARLTEQADAILKRCGIQPVTLKIRH